MIMDGHCIDHQPLTEQAMTKQAVPEQAMTEQAVPEQAMTEQAVSEHAMTEHAVTELAMTEQQPVRRPLRRRPKCSHCRYFPEQNKTITAIEKRQITAIEVRQPKVAGCRRCGSSHIASACTLSTDELRARNPYGRARSRHGGLRRRPISKRSHSL